MSSPNSVGQVQGGITAAQGFISVVVANYGAVALQLTGTFSGTVQFEATVDNDNWVSVALTPSIGGSAVTSATAPGMWQGDCGGYYAVRARCSAFTSGVIYVSINASVVRAGESVVLVDEGLSGTGAVGDPVNVLVDDVTIGISGANELEVLTEIPAIDATFLTATDETGTLTGSRQLLAGTNVTFDDTTPGERTVNASGGGGGSPAGDDTQIQFNDSGSFGASENLTFDGTTLTVPAVNISTANPVLTFTETGGGSSSNFQQAPNGDFSLSMTGPDNQVLGFDGDTGDATFLASVSAAELHAVNGASGTGTTITAITVEDGIIRSITVS